MLTIHQQAFDEFTVQAIAPPLGSTITKAGSIDELCAIIRHYYTMPHATDECPICLAMYANLAATRDAAKGESNAEHNR